MNQSLSHIRIVLVEPAGPLNVGAVARIMRNMGLSRLVLVNPQCDPTAEEAQHMAVHGGDVLTAARVVQTLPEALAGCQRAIATTGRLHPQDHPLETPEHALPWLLPESPGSDIESDIELDIETALIFGPEDRGLSNEELMYAQRWIRIPAREDYPSLNLAQAVGVCAYLLHRQLHADAAGPAVQKPAAPMPQPPSPEQAPLDQVEFFFQDLESLLLKIGYLYPHTAASRMAKLRRLLHRTGSSSQELAMLRGILRQVNWALEHPDAGTSSSP